MEDLTTLVSSTLKSEDSYIIKQKSIAICCWGMTRSTKLVYKTYQDHLFSVLQNAGITYDLYMHTWKAAPQIWGNPIHIPVDYEEYKYLEPFKYVIEDQDEFLKTMNFSDYFYDSNDDWCPKLLKNHICALESQKRATELCLASGKQYTYIIFIRPDLRIDNDFPVDCLTKLNLGDCCVVPYAEHEGYNDTLAVMRFEDCQKYGKRIEELEEFRRTQGRITSEKYVKYTLDKYYKNVYKIDFRSIMIRPNGRTPYVPQD
jgi:hypothetical protein